MRILITGTTQGIGKAISERLEREERYKIFTINRRALKSEFIGGCRNFICDLTDIESVKRMCNEIRHMEWDVLINNAGGAEPSKIEEISPRILEKCTMLNYISPVLLMQAVLPGMEKRRFGKIINMTSIAAKSPRITVAHYGAAKAALENFSKSIAVYYAGRGITVNCICPGGVETLTSSTNRMKQSEIMYDGRKSRQKLMVESNGLGRLISPNEIAEIVVFLLSEHASVISGQSVNVCGVLETH